MIIWINGAFGVGKTEVAKELSKRIKKSYIYDPENIGITLRNNMPEYLYKNDFQDYGLWRDFNYEMIKYLYEFSDDIIIIPMTIYKKKYYDQIIKRLLDDNINLKHFILTASPETIHKRLKGRLESKNSFARQLVDKCVHSLENNIPGEKIVTDNKDPYEIAEEIGRISHQKLSIDPTNKIKREVNKKMEDITLADEIDFISDMI